jgi:hypothetical protein
VSYSCCSTECPHCHVPLCGCTCQAAKDETAAIEARARFVAAYHEMEQALLLFTETHPNKYVTLLFNTTTSEPSGPAMYGRVTVGLYDRTHFGNARDLWNILRSRTPKP